ncbi:MAG: lysozyme [Hyphomonadaceae bacterium]
MSATLPSPACLALVKRFEGLHLEPQPLDGDRWVVGYNHVRRGAPGAPIDATEAEYLLKEDLEEFAQIIRGTVFASLNQNQFDALVSFGFSVGHNAFARSDVLQMMNGGRALEAAAAMDGWAHSAADGQIVDHLVRRRAAEKALFLTEEEASPSAASAVIRPSRGEAEAAEAAPVEEKVDPVGMVALGALGLLLIAMGVTGADEDHGLAYLVFAGPGAVAVAMSVYHLLKRAAAA